MIEPLYTNSDIDFLRNYRPLVMAHRGRSAFTPESSYKAFKEAYDLNVDVLEIDLRLSKDQIPIVFHDETLDRTTDGKGLVDDHNIKELQELNLGYWFQDNETGEYPYRDTECRPLTLLEFLEKFPKIRVNMEIKDEDNFAPKVIYDTILESGAENRVLVASFHHRQLATFRELSKSKNIPTSASPLEVLAFLFHILFFTARKFCALQVPIEMYSLKAVTKKKILRAHKRNLAVHPWTINDEKTMKNLLEWGIDGIFTDNPDLLLEILSSIL